jgi:hypothetical protein
MIVKAVIVASIIIAAQAAAPIPKQKGKQCPVNYAESGGYCVPFGNAKPAIPKGKGACPSGYSESGGACVKMR